jgi:7-carboxy-7-deazaguanine synthase
LDRTPLKRLIEQYPYQLKFVASPDEIAEIEGLLADLGSVAPDRVMLMAEGIDARTLHERERLLVPICMSHGWRLTPRFQIDLFGNTKGT